MTCEECSGALAFIGRHGGIKLFRCAQCAKDFHVLTSPSLEPDQRWLLVIWWSTGFLSARELARLRMVSPRALGLPATEIWNQSKETGWELGMFSDPAAERMMAWCAELGLNVRQESDAARPSPYLWAFSREGMPKHALMIVWPTEVPTVRELAHLRKVSPRAAQLRVTDVRSQARRDKCWYLGSFPEEEADRLEDRCRELGLSVERAPRRQQPPQ